MADRQNESSYEITWTAFAVQDGKAPDVDTVIEVRRGESIHLQLDTTASTNVSTDTDINVISSSDGTNYDTVPYATLANLGDAAVQSIMVTPGPKFMKLRADNNDGSNSSAPIVRIWIRS
jgi:hypothetical protein